MGTFTEMKLSLAIFSLANAASVPAKIGYDVSAPMIIGGNVAAEAQFPWQISQRRIQGGQPGSHMCGGSLAGTKIVVSAAHCVMAPNRLVVAYGTNTWKSNDNLAYLEKFVSHPNYSPTRIDWDYSYMILQEEVVFSDSVRPISLVPPNENSKYNNQLYGATATTSGWGYSKHDASGNPIVIPDDLQWVELPLNDWETCTGYWGDSELHPVVGRYSARMQCCGGQGSTSCMGDSGGPLMVSVDGEYKLLGAVSWGSNTCVTTQAGVYSNIAYPAGRQWYQDELGL